MRKAKVKKIVLSGYGSFLGMEKGSFVVRDKNGEERKYPLFEEEIARARYTKFLSLKQGYFPMCPRRTNQRN